MCNTKTCKNGFNLYTHVTVRLDSKALKLYLGMPLSSSRVLACSEMFFIKVSKIDNIQATVLPINSYN